MKTYEVTQTLVRERVVHVEATSRNEARVLARNGAGTVVSGDGGRLQLLCDSATELEARVADA